MYTIFEKNQLKYQKETRTTIFLSQTPVCPNSNTKETYLKAKETHFCQESQLEWFKKTHLSWFKKTHVRDETIISLSPTEET